MSLTLRLELVRGDVPLGGEIRLRLTLRNEDASAAEVASLFDNNTITNYVLYDGAGNELVVLNHVTRQEVMEKGEPRTTDMRLVALQPGDAETRDDNLCRYFWIDRPGHYYVQGLYRWNDLEVRSERQPLEILPAPLQSYDQQWSFHYGEKFLLDSCWVTGNHEGGHELFLRQSLRFRPQAINYNPSLGSGAVPASPRVSFNRSLIAGGSVWLAWLDDTGVTALRTEGGVTVVSARHHDIPLQGLDWAASPLTSESGELIVLVSGIETGGGRRVLALHLDRSGNELRRGPLTPSLRGVVFITAACDEDQGFHLFWATGDSFEIWHLPIDLANVQPTGVPERLWQSESSPLALLFPPVLSADSFLCCLFVRTSERGYRVGVAWLQLAAGLQNPLKIEEVDLAGADSLLRVSGEVNAGGRLFAILTTARSVRYLDGQLMRTREIAATQDLDPEGGEWLTVNHRGDVFFTASRRGFGLFTTSVRSGDEDDEELGEGETSR